MPWNIAVDLENPALKRVTGLLPQLRAPRPWQSRHLYLRFGYPDCRDHASLIIATRKWI